MKEILFPRRYYQTIYDIDFENMRNLGMEGLIVDIDNTVVPWNSWNISERLRNWIEYLKGLGYKICLMSNGQRKRIKHLADELGIQAVVAARKPSKRGYEQGIKFLNISSDKILVVGDQIFTDILGGNRMNLYTILVNPIGKREFITTKLMRQIEKIVMYYYKKDNNFILRETGDD